jgi:hypothetical protein
VPIVDRVVSTKDGDLLLILSSLEYTFGQKDLVRWNPIEQNFVDRRSTDDKTIMSSPRFQCGYQTK